MHTSWQEDTSNGLVGGEIRKAESQIGSLAVRLRAHDSDSRTAEVDTNDSVVSILS